MYSTHYVNIWLLLSGKKHEKSPITWRVPEDKGEQLPLTWLKQLGIQTIDRNKTTALQLCKK